jgi:bifunctional UDP-N-acetylglucosamine pyrophosphorylase/glucosamine-1-phosphate N-acetyltransferase
VVVGYHSSEITKVLESEAPPELRLEFVEQAEQRGTGDAAAVGLTGFPAGADLEDGDLVVLPGDAPLLRPTTLAALVRAHRQQDAAATLLTARVEDPSGYGRVVRAKDGGVSRIVEHLDATAEELEIDEVSTSIYCFRHSVLAPALRRLAPSNAKSEIYLTDSVAVLDDAGYRVVTLLADDPTEAAGVNDRAQLAAAAAVLRERINERWMRRGVTMTDPSTTYVDGSVQLGDDVTLLPGVVLEGQTSIGDKTIVGPGTRLVDCEVGAGARLEQTTGASAVVGDDAVVGPYAVLEPGCRLAPGTTTGPFFSSTTTGVTPLEGSQ